MGSMGSLLNVPKFCSQIPRAQACFPTRTVGLITLARLVKRHFQVDLEACPSEVRRK